MRTQRIPSPSAGITKTNPVWALSAVYRFHPNRSTNRSAANKYLKQWMAEAVQNGVLFSASIRRTHRSMFEGVEIKTAEPRVVGLLVRHQTGEEPLGLVTPIRATVNQSSRSNVSRFLPFDEMHLRWAIDQLICCNTDSPPSPFTVLRSFQVDEQLKEHAHGSSMDIAGVLAVIDACSSYKCPLLERACAVVAPVGNGNTLEEVEDVDVKLQAFKREIGEGTLLVCARGGWAAQHCQQDFEQVWEVATFEDLNAKLRDAQLLQPLLDDSSLTSRKLETAKAYVSFLESESGISCALEYAERIEQHAGACSARIRLSLADIQAHLNRHIGNVVKAVHFAQRCVKEIEALHEFTSFQELCHAQVSVAAGLYDQHSFAAARDLLLPLLEQAAKRRDLLDAGNRVELNNTLARCLVMLEEDGWEQLFLESLKIQEAVDPESRSRTGCYLIYGYLRSNRLVEAGRWLEEFSGQAKENMYLCFHAQDYLRRGGKQLAGIDRILESQATVRGHALGMFFQARARMQLDSAAAATHFRDAETAFASECEKQDRSNLLHLFKSFMQLAAACCEESKPEMELAITAIWANLNGAAPTEVAEWYRPYLPNQIDRHAVERLLERSPYF